MNDATDYLDPEDTTYVHFFAQLVMDLSKRLPRNQKTRFIFENLAFAFAQGWSERREPQPTDHDSDQFELALRTVWRLMLGEFSDWTDEYWKSERLNLESTDFKDCFERKSEVADALDFCFPMMRHGEMRPATATAIEMILCALKPTKSKVDPSVVY